VPEFEFLRVLRGFFFAFFAVKVFERAWNKSSRAFDREVRKGKAAKYAKKFKLRHDPSAGLLV